MKKTIYAVVVLFCWATASATIHKDPLKTARQLYAAGRWAAAQYEYDRAPQSAETEIFSTLSAVRMGEPDAAARLEELQRRYPDSKWTNDMRFGEGLSNYDSGNYEAALAGFARVSGVSGNDRDEFYFKRGHTLFLAGMDDDARADFANVSESSSYAHHADYFVAYMDYSHGNYTAARSAFESLAKTPDYSALAPYYLLQIQYLTGDWRGAAEGAEARLNSTMGPRRAELAGIAAQSRFKLGEYDRAIANVQNYMELGGYMSRSDHYTAGFSFYRSGRLAEAKKHLMAATGADDAISQNASYHLADIYLGEGDRARAMQSFSIAAASGADAVIAEDALFNYGKLLFEAGGGHFNEAINVLRRYIDTYPYSGDRVAEARQLLIASYWNSRDYDAAYEAIIQHPNPDGDVRGALQKITYFRGLNKYSAGQLTEAQRLLKESAAVRQNAKYTALASFWQGEIAYAVGDYADAAARYEEYLRLASTAYTESLLARYGLGYVNFSLQRWGDAQRWFEDFLAQYSARNSFRADALNRLGDIRHAARQYRQAVEAYDAAASIGTNEQFYAAYQRAMMLGLAGEPDRKIAALESIIASGSGDYVEQAEFELGRYLISLDRFAAGAKALEGFVSRWPQSTLQLSTLSNLGLAHLNLGERAEALNFYKQVVDRAPYSPEAQDAMAGIRGIYVDAGDVTAYFNYAREAGAPADVGEASRDSLAFVAAERLYLAGNSTRAIEALEAYVGGKGQHVAAATNYLSELYAGAERWAEAGEAYKRLIGIAPNPATRRRAIDGYVVSVINEDNPLKIKEMAAEIERLSDAPSAARQRAQMAKAGVLRAEERAGEAAEIYRSLAADPSTEAGAESAYRVIENLYESGDYKRAEEAVFAFSQAGTPHSYWLGQAFLVLGDVYARGGDSFQARATYQSIVDGYSPADDGVVDAAKKRIANLK